MLAVLFLPRSIKFISATIFCRSFRGFQECGLGKIFGFGTSLEPWRARGFEVHAYDRFLLLRPSPCASAGCSRVELTSLLRHAMSGDGSLSPLPPALD